MKDKLKGKQSRNNSESPYPLPGNQVRDKAVCLRKETGFSFSNPTLRGVQAAQQIPRPRAGLDAGFILPGSAGAGCEGAGVHGRAQIVQVLVPWMGCDMRTTIPQMFPSTDSHQGCFFPAFPVQLPKLRGTRPLSSSLFRTSNGDPLNVMGEQPTSSHRDAAGKQGSGLRPSHGI